MTGRFDAGLLWSKVEPTSDFPPGVARMPRMDDSTRSLKVSQLPSSHRISESVFNPRLVFDQPVDNLPEQFRRSHSLFGRSWTLEPRKEIGNPRSSNRKCLVGPFNQKFAST